MIQSNIFFPFIISHFILLPGLFKKNTINAHVDVGTCSCVRPETEEITIQSCDLLGPVLLCYVVL